MMVVEPVVLGAPKQRHVPCEGRFLWRMLWNRDRGSSGAGRWCRHRRSNPRRPEKRSSVARLEPCGHVPIEQGTSRDDAIEYVDCYGTAWTHTAGRIDHRRGWSHPRWALQPRSRLGVGWARRLPPGRPLDPLPSRRRVRRPSPTRRSSLPRAGVGEALLQS